MMKCENNDKVPVCGSNGAQYNNQCELNAASCLSGHIVDKDLSRPLLYTLHEGNCTGTVTHTFIALHNPDVLLNIKRNV